MAANANETILPLTDSELALLILGLLLEERIPAEMRRMEGYKEAREKVRDALDWLLEADAFSGEEAAGWQELRAKHF